ncbi:MAG: substrate-binding domain-containing protein [Breznakia sp.]
MKITIKKIAEMAGVSRGTVDRVINNRGKVDRHVEERIKKIILETGYDQKRVKSRKFQIGVITQLSSASFMEEIKKGINEGEKFLNTVGSTLTVKYLEGVNVSEQVQSIEELINQGIDALAIMPINHEQVRDKLNDIKRKYNIPIIAFNTNIISAGIECFVGMDNYQSGIVAADILALLMRNKGKVLAITGHFGNSATSDRIEGFTCAMEKNYPEIDIVSTQSSLDKASEVKRIIAETRILHPDLEGIFLASAGQAGVRQSIGKAKKRPYIIVYDVTRNNIERIKNNDFDFIIDQDSENQSYTAIKLLFEILCGNTQKEKIIYTNIQLKNRSTLH